VGDVNGLTSLTTHMMWCDVLWYDIWYDILLNCSWVDTRWQ